MIDALLALLTVWTAAQTGDPVYVAHCRTRDGGCPEYVAQQVLYASAASDAWDVPLALLLAVAFHESGFSRDRIGLRGEVTMFQLHPRGCGARAKRMQRDDGVPADYAAAFTAAQELHRGLVHCGNWRGALTFYNQGRGRCHESSYARRVMAIRAQL